jgi:hypothetical protein
LIEINAEKKNSNSIALSQYATGTIRRVEEKGALIHYFHNFPSRRKYKFRTYIQEILHRKPARLTFIFGPGALKKDFLEELGSTIPTFLTFTDSY